MVYLDNILYLWYNTEQFKKKGEINMHIKELTLAEFDLFSKTCPLGSYHQTSNYALFMAENNYDYDLIGFVDELGVIKAAALILIKNINITTKYGYSPKGFLIDYFNLDLLKEFTKALKLYYAKKLAFIKINPEIAIGEINKKTKVTDYNHNLIIRDYLKECGCIKLKDNLYFEAILPRFNAIINLEEYTFDRLSKNTRNKIRKAENKRLIIEKVDRSHIDELYEFIKRKTNYSSYYYHNYYNAFSTNESCDLFLIKIDYQKYLLSSKKLYDKELENNNKLSELVIREPNDININNKMNSDKALLSYKNDIELATKNIHDNKETYIAGAITIKYNNRVNIIVSGIDPKYKKFNANYFLHYKLIEFYKKNFKFLDLNGITGDFSDNNFYKGLNDFKIGFKPHLYEFIGEFDFIINEKSYYVLQKKGLLAKEFNHPKNKEN